MLRLFVAATFCVIAVSTCVFAQLPNQQGQVWREYDLSTVAVPPPAIKVFSAATPADLPMQAPSIIEIVKRETGEAAWSGPGFGLIGTNGQKLFVYNSPVIQQRVAETIGRFQRPETKNVRFVMESKFLTLSDSFFERWGVEYNLTHLNNLPKVEVATDKAESQADAIFVDARTPVIKYLHPILGSDGKPACKQPGVSAYWVAKDDIPKVWEIWNRIISGAEGDTRSNLLQGPQVETLNGQLGAILDTVSKPFTTDMVPVASQSENEFRPVQTVFKEGSSLAAFSLLSWDGRTVCSDVHAEFSQVRGLSGSPVVDNRKKNGTWVEVPNVERTMLSEKGLVWPADGMLVVFMGGMRRLSEGRVETGSPLFNKIPFLNRKLTSNTAIWRDVQTINGILTIKMIPPTEPPQTANARSAQYR